MLTVWHPFNKLMDVANVAAKYPNIPDYITKWRILSTADGKKGVKNYNLLYVKDDKIVDAEIYLARLMQEFTDVVEGYNYKVEVVFSGSDLQKVQSVKLL